VLDRREERAERRKLHIAELRKRAAEADEHPVRQKLTIPPPARSTRNYLAQN
jgi:hypothetical protein